MAGLVACLVGARLATPSIRLAVPALVQLQQQRGRSTWGAWVGGAAAAVAVAGGVAACDTKDNPTEKPIEKPKGKPSVDFAKVRKDIADLLEKDSSYDDGSYGPFFVRLAWHSSGTYCKTSKTGGSHPCSIRFEPESNHGANAGLKLAMKLLNDIKQKHPDIGFGDLYTLAGVVAIEEMGGPKIKWCPGRKDVATSGKDCTPDGRLPDAAQGAAHLRAVFGRMGFNDQEIVALSGAHALGRCHPDRSGFKGPWTRAPTTFSNEYFKLLLKEKWTPKNWSGPKQFQDSTGQLMMLPTDLALIEDPKFCKWVEIYAKDETKFANDFSKAFTKLLSLGVPRPWWKRIFGL